MSKLKRKARQIMVRWLIRFFTMAIRNVIAWEMAVAKQEDCKHEGQEGTYCGLCGKAMRDPDEAEFEGVMSRVVESVLIKHNIIKKPKTGNEPPPPKTTLADRLMKGKK